MTERDEIARVDGRTSAAPAPPSPEAAMDRDEVREQIARIVDPLHWRQLDEAATSGSYGLNQMTPEERFAFVDAVGALTKSLAKADAILALLPQTGARGAGEVTQDDVAAGYELLQAVGADLGQANINRAMVALSRHRRQAQTEAAEGMRERAAKVAENEVERAEAEIRLYDSYGGPESSMRKVEVHRRGAAKEIATAIRALGEE